MKDQKIEESCKSLEDKHACVKIILRAYISLLHELNEQNLQEESHFLNQLAFSNWKLI